MTNIAELLKDAPKGMKLYSPLVGEVEFAEVMETAYVPIRVMKRGYGLRFDKYGRYMGYEYPDSECLLFPSKDCRTWEGWKLPVEPKFKVGDWVVYCGKTYQITDVGNSTYTYTSPRTGVYFFNDIKVTDNSNSTRFWSIADAKDGDVITNGKLIVVFNKLEEPAYRQHIIAYVGLDLCGRLQITEDTWQLGVDKAMPATKEQRDLLFAKMKEAGYQWDADKKELRKIKPHYDIANFQPFDRVMVRQNNANVWGISWFSRCEDNEFCTCNNVWFNQCIPFEGNEHLLGTTDMCPEEYINW